MQPEKVQAIQDWKTPTNLTDVSSFIGFTNFYWQFIHSISSTIRLLMELTKKDQRLYWDKDQQLDLEEYKWWFTSAPILAHSNLDSDVIFGTDAFGYVSA